MAICRNCGKEISDTAKACRFCGTRVGVKNTDTAMTTGRKCPNCGKEVSETAKACRFCGTRLVATEEKRIITNAINVEPQDASRVQMSEHNGFVTWRILPGQLAVRITEEEYESYGTIKGIIIQEGCKALLFNEGKYIDTLSSGKYTFSDLSRGDTSTVTDRLIKEEGKKNGLRFLGNMFSNGAARIKDWWTNHVRNSATPMKGLSISFVIIRSAEFPLIFEASDVGTANIRSDVSIHFVANISNFEDFYQAQLLDKQFVSINSFSSQIEPLVLSVLSNSLKNVEIDQIGFDTDLLTRIFESLKSSITGIYPFIDVTKIIKISASNQELERIHRMKEELYIADEELSQTQARYDFLNRLQNTEYDQKLREARSKVDFDALMDVIEEDDATNKDRKEEFMMLLLAEKTVREAKSKDEVEAKLFEFEKNGILRTDEKDQLLKNIAQRNALQEIENIGAIDQAKLDWEIAIGNKRFENDMSRKRQIDSYGDERRRILQEEERDEMRYQMDLMRQLKEMEKAEADAVLERSMRQKQQEIDAEAARVKAQNDAMLEKNRIYSGMTFEQIMAANPEITPEAAMALSKKFEADAMATRNDQAIALMAEQNARMEAFLTEQNNRTERMAATSQEQMLSMFQAAMQGLGGIAQTTIKSKDDELGRVRDESQKNEERFANGVNNAVSAVSDSYKGTGAAMFRSAVSYSAQAGTRATGRVCPICGAAISASDRVCPDCEAPIEK